ncbi:hypothetical protein JCM10449v2_007383 [Rhodotorula kratochvilovae]
MSTASPTMHTLQSPPDGANPYTFYRDLLHEVTVLSPPDRAGFRARLIVLYVFTVLLLVVSIVDFGVHALGYRIKGRRMWLFKLVKRDGGTHIVSNHFVLIGIAGASLFVVLFGSVHTLWRSTISPGGGASQDHLAKWQFALWPVAYAVAWLLSWATFQAYLQVQSGARDVFSPRAGKPRRRRCTTMPAWLENTLFLAGGFGTVAVHATLAGIGSAASSEQWRQYHVLDNMLALDERAWDGAPVPPATASELRVLLENYREAASHFYTTASNLSIGAAVLPLFLVVLNLAMFSFIWMIRRHIHFQLSQLPQLQSGFAQHVSPGALSATLPSPRAPVHIQLPERPHERRESDSTRSSKEAMPTLASHVLDTLPTLSPRADSDWASASPSPPRHTLPLPSSPSFRPSSAIPFSPPALPSLTPSSRMRSPTILTHDPLTGIEYLEPRVLPTRAQVLELADDIEAAKTGAPEQQLASRITALIKAEQELLVLGLTVILVASALAITCAWSVPVLRRFTSASWQTIEAVLTVPLWICAVGLSVAEAVHAWLEIRYVILPWWRRERFDKRERRLSVTSGAGGGSPPRTRETPLAPLAAGASSGLRSLARGLELSLSPSAVAAAVGLPTRPSAPPRRASNFERAIAIDVEVTREEEVGDEEPLPLDVLRRVGQDGADAKASCGADEAERARGAARAAEGWAPGAELGGEEEKRRRREAWEDH